MADDASKHTKKKVSRGLSTTNASPASSSPVLAPSSQLAQPALENPGSLTPNSKDKKKSKKHLEVASPRLSVSQDQAKHGKDKDKKDKVKQLSSIVYQQETDEAFPQAAGILYKYNGSFKGTYFCIYLFFLLLFKKKAFNYVF